MMKVKNLKLYIFVFVSAISRSVFDKANLTNGLSMDVHGLSYRMLCQEIKMPAINGISLRCFGWR